MVREYYTDAEVLQLLRRRVKEAGSILAVAKGDISLSGALSRVLRGQRSPTSPSVVRALGLEVVYRERI
jgi:hypothetical protein